MLITYDQLGTTVIRIIQDHRVLCMPLRWRGAATAGIWASNGPSLGCSGAREQEPNVAGIQALRDAVNGDFEGFDADGPAGFLMSDDADMAVEIDGRVGKQKMPLWCLRH